MKVRFMVCCLWFTAYALLVRKEKSELVDKPGSVVDNHSSRRLFAQTLKQPTRIPCGPHVGSLFGLATSGVYPATNCYQSPGALLPHPFTLTCALKKAIGGLLSVALVVGSRLPDVIRHSDLCSPDFPLVYLSSRLFYNVNCNNG